MSGSLSERHKIPVAARHLQKEAETALNKDIARALAELIKNSVDSINRGVDNGEKVSNKVKIEYSGILKTLKFGITDEAEGMNGEWLEKATRHGEKVSGFEEGKHVHGLFGAGLKHVMCSMEEAKTLTIREGKLSRCLFYNNWERQIDKYDELVTKEDRDKTKININGTFNSFILPQDWAKPMNIDKLGKKLDNLYLLRLININDKYEIDLIDLTNKRYRRIEYKEPKSKTFKDDKDEDFEKFKIYHPQLGKFNVHMIIKIAESDLEPNVDDYSHRGLIIHNEDGVVYDHTLFKYNREYFANRIFGYVKIENFNEILKKDETVLNVHRLGLNYHNNFCNKLQEETEKRLDKAVEKEKKERQSKKGYESFADLSSEALKELSKIYNDIVGRGEGGDTPPKDPELPKGGLAFYPSQTTLLNNIKKRVYLIVNKNKVKSDQEINLTKQNDESSVDIPNKLTYTPSERYKDKKIDIIGFNITASTHGKQETIIASSDGCENSNMAISVDQDPRQNLPNGFGFFPDNLNISDGEERNASLFIDSSKIRGKSIKVSSTDPKSIKVITNVLNIDKGTNYINDIQELKVTIIGRGIGQSGVIVAEIDGINATLKIKVIRKKLEGIFKDARLVDDRAPQERASPEGNIQEGYIINVHKNNPVIAMYTRGDYLKSSSHWAIFADTVLFMATSIIARDMLLKNRVTIEAEPSRDEVESKRIELEYQHGKKIHEIFLTRLSKERMLEED